MPIMFPATMFAYMVARMRMTTYMVAGFDLRTMVYRYGWRMAIMSAQPCTRTWLRKITDMVAHHFITLLSVPPIDCINR